MGYLHRYWFRSEAPNGVPNPPRELRPSRLAGPVHGVWWCLDVSKPVGLNVVYAEELSRGDGVEVVVGPDRWG